MNTSASAVHRSEGTAGEAGNQALRLYDKVRLAPNRRRVLESLAESLRVRFPNAQQKIWRKGYPAKLAPFLKEMAAESDVAISGVGH